MKFLLIKRGLYWRPNAQGYTGIRDEAGRYSLAEAKLHNGHGVRMIREDRAAEFAPACFQDLQIAHLQTKRDAAEQALAQAREARNAAQLLFRAPLSSVEFKLVDKHCDWVAFGHAWNAVIKHRLAALPSEPVNASKDGSAK